MMICTCDNCHYTFQSDALPPSCPDCGKESINRRIDTRIISSPAVREATEAETVWFVQVQKELAAEEHQKETLKSLDSFGMTDDEYNWAMVMLFTHGLPTTEEARNLVRSQLRIALKDPKKALDHYQMVRRIFTNNISSDRKALEKAGKHEPFSVASMNDDGETVLDDGMDDYGPALSILYRFRPYDFLQVPTLGNLRRIDLKKIAEEPSAGYAQFLLDCF